MLRCVPMPTVEYMDPNPDLAIYSLSLTTGSGAEENASASASASGYSRWSEHANTSANKYEGAY